MLMLLPITTMRMEHHNIAPSQRLAPDGAREIVEALHATTPERAQHARRVLVKGRAEHGRHRQDHVPRDHPLVKQTPPTHALRLCIIKPTGFLRLSSECHRCFSKHYRLCHRKKA